jgi:hypothetical protein
MITVKASVLAASAAHDHAHWWRTLANWGYIGGLLGGVSTFVLAAAAIIGGSAGLGDWRAKQQAQKALAQEQAQTARLDRHRVLNGWTPHGVHVYGVALVTSEDEMTQAQEQLTAGGPSDYVILRVNESSSGNSNRAHSLRRLIADEGFIARAPGTGEFEALEAGRGLLLGTTSRTPLQ